MEEYSSPTTVKEVKVDSRRIHSCWSSPKIRFLLNAVAVKCIAPHVKESGDLPVEFGIRENLSSACRIQIGIQKTSSTNQKDVQNPTVPWIPSDGQGILPVPRTKKNKLCKEEIEKKKTTDLTNGSLNAQKFLLLNPLLIWILIIVSCWSAVYTVILGELL